MIAGNINAINTSLFSKEFVSLKLICNKFAIDRHISHIVINT